MKIYGWIYKATCVPTGKSYIGLTTEFNVRKNFHLWASKNGNNKYPKFYNALRKYGAKNFEWKLIDCSCNVETLRLCEKYWIKKFDTFHNGLNCTEGGDGIHGYRHSEETKKKIGLANLKRKGIKTGKKASKETRMKMSLAHRNISNLTRERMRQGQLNRRR